MDKKKKGNSSQTNEGRSFFPWKMNGKEGLGEVTWAREEIESEQQKSHGWMDGCLWHTAIGCLFLHRMEGFWARMDGFGGSMDG